MRRPWRRPNVVILHTDQQRYDTIRAAGNEVMHTPNLDRLGERGALLERFYVQNPVCMPSRASMLSGRYPQATTVTCNGIEMPLEIRCIQHMLGDAGYFTGVIGKLHFLPHSARDHRKAHPAYGFDQLQICDEPGCYRDAYREWVRQQDPSQLDAVNCGLPPARATWERMMGWDGTVRPPEPREGFVPRTFEADESLTNACFVADRSVQFIRERGDRPFMLFAGFYHPHSPLIPPQCCLDLYDVEDIPLPVRAEHEGLAPTAEGLSDRDFQEIRRHYYAMVSDVDRNVGRILNALDERGLTDDTIVVFTSDHGDYMGDHGKFGKGMPGYDCIMRVPCLICYPGEIEPGRRVEGLVEAVDLVPTLLDYAGVVREPELQGRSIRPLLDGDDSAARESVFAQYSTPGGACWAHVRTGQFMYSASTGGAELLFDLQADPHELTNLAGRPDAGEALAEMRRLALARSLQAQPQAPRVAPY
ncbi:MAG: sulfatase family protein [Armatimonadota bacterium]